MNYKIFALSILLTVFAGCRSSRMTELQRFERSVLKELPFSVDSISWLTSGDFPTFRFANTEYIGACPDCRTAPTSDRREHLAQRTGLSQEPARCVHRPLPARGTNGGLLLCVSERKERISNLRHITLGRERLS